MSWSRHSSVGRPVSEKARLVVALWLPSATWQAKATNLVLASIRHRTNIQARCALEDLLPGSSKILLLCSIMSDFVHVESPTKVSREDASDAQPPQPAVPSRPDLDFLNAHPFVRSTVIDKIYGCLMGSALGDTIGLYTEFLPKQACESIYKERKFSLLEPVTEWHPDSHRSKCHAVLFILANQVLTEL